jgi:hypothetical protein
MDLSGARYGSNRDILGVGRFQGPREGESETTSARWSRLCPFYAVKDKIILRQSLSLTV